MNLKCVVHITTNITMPTATCSICFEGLLTSPPSNKNNTATNSNNNNIGNASNDDDEAGVVSATLCGHVFHTACVRQWVGVHKHCPQCRRPVDANSALVKLFLAEEDQHRKSPSGDSDGSVRRELLSRDDKSEAAVAVVEERLVRSEREREDSKIIQVFQ